MPKGPQRVRLKDIAQDLGLSIMAVSKALRGHSDIGRATRQRVLRRAGELGYQPNQLARQLAAGRSRIIGMVVPTLAYSFFGQLAQGVSTELRKRGYQLLMCNSEAIPAREREQIRSLIAHQVEGIVLASCGPLTGVAELAGLRESGVPFVFAGRGLPAFAANFVGSDGIAIGRMVTTHLVKQGCHRVAHLEGPPVAGSTQRAQGYREALEQNGFRVESRMVVRAGDGMEAGYRAMRQLLRRTPRPDGVFSYNDAVAAGALKAILEAGLRVPADIALAGVGNNTFSDLWRVPLTTVDQSAASMGVRAAALLTESPRRQPCTVIVPAKLIVRESSLKSSSLLTQLRIQQLEARDRKGYARKPSSAEDSES